MIGRPVRWRDGSRTVLGYVRGPGMRPWRPVPARTAHGASAEVVEHPEQNIVHHRIRHSQHLLRSVDVVGQPHLVAARCQLDTVDQEAPVLGVLDALGDRGRGTQEQPLALRRILIF
jgi:hypothetical protein